MIIDCAFGHRNRDVDNLRRYASYIDKMRPLVNVTAFITLQKRMGFSEVTGGRALSFCNVSMGETAGLPLDRAGGNAEGAKLPRRYVAEKTSPRALELKKSPSLLKKYDVFKGLKMYH